MGFKDTARFYRINGQELPSVTTALSILHKPALVPWAVNQERKAFEAAMLDVLSRPGRLDPDSVLNAVISAVSGIKAADRESAKARTIGTGTHALIEWHTRRMLGEDAGPEPIVPDAAVWAVETWKEWAAEVSFTPLIVERVVYCEGCGYAGTVDWIGTVRGIMTLGDYKTGKAIYPEAYLQNEAYRHAAKRQGFATEQGIIVRLPKTADDPAFEAMCVPPTDLNDFLAALRLWRWQRTITGQQAGRKRQPAAVCERLPSVRG